MPENTNGGWIRSHRAIENKADFSDPLYFRVFYHFLHMAQWSRSEVDIKGEKVTLERGQCYFKYRPLAKKFGVTVGVIRGVISDLHNHERIIRTGVSTRYNLVTIVNYDTYQDIGDGANTTSNTRSNTSSNTTINTKNKKVIKQEGIKQEGNKQEKTLGAAETEPRKSSKRKKPEYSPEDRILANWFLEQIQATLPDPIPDRSRVAHRWADTFRLMRERDKRTEARIKAVVTWALADDFWSKTLQSPTGLRKHWITITKKMGGSSSTPDKSSIPSSKEIAQQRKKRQAELEERRRKLLEQQNL